MTLILFETDRLYGREISAEDGTRLTEILSDSEVMKYSVQGVCDEQSTRKFIAWCISCYSDLGIGSWALIEKRTGRLAGFCGVSPDLVDGAELMNLGYRLAKEYWNQGLATEAVNGVLDYIFGENLIDSLVVIIEPEHVTSLRVAEKVGFSEYSNRKFHGRKVRLYRLSAQDWVASRRDLN
jgi:RimJ/RimL family protein N-acetyltransferase